MRHFLLGLLFFSIFLSSCGTVAVKVNWNPDDLVSEVSATPIGYLTPDWTATFVPKFLPPSPTATAISVFETPRLFSSDATPTPPTAIMPGASLAFVRQNHLCWVDTGGKIYLLSDSVFTASSPLVSPDHSLVVYLESRSGSVLEGLLLKDIVLASTTRSFESRTLVGDSTDRLLSFSPDGQWVLTQRAEFKQTVGLFYYGLHIINVNSGEDRELLAPLGFPNDPPILPVNPTWSPDSQHIFFDRKPVSADWPPRLELNVVNIRTGETRILLDVNQSGNLVFSPDGGRLLVAGGTQLSLFDLQRVYDFSADATPRVLMSYELPRDGLLGYALPQVFWAGPELVRLALPGQQDGHSLLTFWDISVVDAQSTLLTSYLDVLGRQEVLDVGGAYLRNRMHPLWSPDMRLGRAALNQYIEFGGVARSDILLLDETGKNPVEFLHNAQFISWSPNGLHFLFISGREENVVNSQSPFDLYVGNAENAGNSQLLLSGTEAAVLLPTVRWLDGQTYIFNAIGPDGETQFWRGVIGSSPLRLD